MKTLDFPAGHSMDTDWFAVDKNGNIAVFNSWQEGAVPIEIERQTNRLELLEKYTTPVTSVLKLLYLDKRVIENLLSKCRVEVLQDIVENEFSVDGCVLLLKEGKKWEDLNLDEVLAKKGSEFALCLSATIPLYLISDIYSIRKEFIAAIKSKVIAKACNFSTVWDDEDKFDGVGVKDLGIYLYDHEDRDWRTEPYCKTYSPEIPIKASQFVSDLEDKIPYFKDISFENQYLIQPMEFFSCETYLGQDEKINGYAKVVSSDNQKEYCLLPVSSEFIPVFAMTATGNERPLKFTSSA